ncbi:prolactin-releasing peptide receptor-like [Haliotis cracherodii]|uniref:prolactin-releasing peptide receptor-like n=1 Tax=Haliotis cracherodii TaxID=6455 RepID=UPI0039E8295B
MTHSPNSEGSVQYPPAPHPANSVQRAQYTLVQHTTNRVHTVCDYRRSSSFLETTALFKITCQNRSITLTTRERFIFHAPTMMFMLLILVVGIFGNILVLYIYTRKIRIHIFGFFVKLLAVFDLVSTVVAVPTTLISRLTSPDDVDAGHLCQVMTFVKHFNTLNSGLIFIIIAVQRYKKVCQPYNSQMSEMLAKKLCLISICVSAIASTPHIFFVRDTLMCIERGSDFVLVPICEFSSYTKLTVQSIMLATWVCVELIGITATLTVLYSAIVKALRTHNRDRAASLRSTQNSSRDKTRTATITFFVLTVVFLLSSAPSVVLTVYFSLVKFDMYNLSHAQIETFDLAVNLMFLNCAINQFVYSFTSSMFRRHFKRVLCAWNSGEQTSETQDSQLQSQHQLPETRISNTT